MIFINIKMDGPACKANFRLKICCILLVVSWQAVLLLAKRNAYEGLSYTADLFGNYQSALAWIYDRPFFHNTQYGPQSYSHNYFILLLLGPFAALFGALSLFTLLAALNAKATLAALELITGYRNILETLSVLSILLVLVSGPVGILILDEPFYGWHAELLAAPLSLLFLVSLTGNKTSKWLWGTLLILVYEQGALAAGSVHLLCEFATRPLFHRAAWRQRVSAGVKLLLFYGCLFLLGVWVLKHYSEFAAWRLARALTILSSCVTASGFGRAIAGLLYYPTKLLIPGLLIIFWRGGARLCALVLLGLMPLLATNLVASALYFSDCSDHIGRLSLLWPPRLAVLWGYLVGGVTLALAAKERIDSNGGAAFSFRNAVAARLATIKAWCPRYAPILALLLLSFGLWLAQHLVLAKNYGYEANKFVALALANKPAALRVKRLSEVEYHALKCISAKLPRNTPIATGNFEMAIFERHYAIFAHKPEMALATPSIVICDSLNRLGDDTPGETAACKVLLDHKLQQGFDKVQIGAYLLGFDPTKHEKTLFSDCAK